MIGSGRCQLRGVRAGGFAANITLATLDDTNGLRLDGTSTGDFSGRAVGSAGDVNGDGLDDLIVGAYRADPNGDSSGASYVVFGQASGFAANFNLSTLDGSNGFRLDGGAANDVSGYAVGSAGDVNGDGFDDLLIGAYGVGPHGSVPGASYVVFGQDGGFAANLNLSTLDGSNGFRVDGAGLGDRSGRAVSGAGDVNGDGFDDFLIGAHGADSNGANAGASYVVFGRASGFAANFNLSTLDGSNGFRLDGVAADDQSGRAVSAAGDFNGDGYDDVLIGAFSATTGGEDSGASYLVFGKADSFAPSINLDALDGENGLRIDGAAAFDYSGFAVSAAGDVNGDGYDDLLIGAQGADPDHDNAGSTYVVFGRASDFGASISLAALDGTNGLRLDGVTADDRSGSAVSAAGDVNGDGYDDLLIGASAADLNGSDSGASYVVFGRDFAATVAWQGGAGNDTLTGTDADESLVGGIGNDVLDGGGGSDALRGARGDDTLVWDANDHHIDGGAGIDTLRIEGSGVTLDLSLIGNHRIAGIERIDLTGTGNNTLSLTVADVLALPDGSGRLLGTATHQLLVDGNAGDSLNAVAQGWVQGDDVNVFGASYVSYTNLNAAVTLFVDADVTRTLS